MKPIEMCGFVLQLIVQAMSLLGTVKGTMNGSARQNVIQSVQQDS
jgi:hypothetical protein